MTRSRQVVLALVAFGWTCLAIEARTVLGWLRDGRRDAHMADAGATGPVGAPYGGWPVSVEAGAEDGAQMGSYGICPACSVKTLVPGTHTCSAGTIKWISGWGSYGSTLVGETPFWTGEWT